MSNDKRRLLILLGPATACTLLYIILLLLDINPNIRGHSDWRWSLLDPPPLLRMMPFGVVAVAYAAFVHRLISQQPTKIWRNLAILFLLAVALQYTGLLVRYYRPLRYLFNIVSSDSINGYFTVAAGIDDLIPFLKTYAQQMPTFPNHVTTHPPGNVIFFHTMSRAVNLLPGAPELIGEPLRTMGCMHPWVQMSNSSVLTGGLAAYVAPLVGLASVVPIFLLAKRQFDVRIAWASAALFPLIPAFWMNLGQTDQAYLLPTVVTGWAFVAGLQDRSYGWLFLSGMVLSFTTFHSFGPLAVLTVLGLYALLLCARGDLAPNAWLFKGAAVFIVGLLVAWVWFGLMTWTNPLAIWRAGLSAHAEAVSRDYATWMVFNLWDFFSLSGVGLVVVLFVGMGMRFRPNPYHLAFTLGLLVLNFSGTTLGEVSRIWLFMMPFLVVAAASMIPSETGKPAGTLTVVALMLLQLGVTAAVLDTPHPRWEEMERPSRVLPTPQVEQPIKFGDSVQLIGYDLNTTTAQAGDQVEAVLFWQVLERPTTAMKSFVHLVFADSGQIVDEHQSDQLPSGRDWPMTCWESGEVYSQSFSFPLKESVPSGKFLLTTGFYSEGTWQRLPIASGQAPFDGAALLSPFSVTP